MTTIALVRVLSLPTNFVYTEGSSRISALSKSISQNGRSIGCRTNIPHCSSPSTSSIVPLAIPTTSARSGCPGLKKTDDPQSTQNERRRGNPVLVAMSLYPLKLPVPAIITTCWNERKWYESETELWTHANLLLEERVSHERRSTRFSAVYAVADTERMCIAGYLITNSSA